MLEFTAIHRRKKQKGPAIQIYFTISITLSLLSIGLAAWTHHQVCNVKSSGGRGNWGALGIGIFVIAGYAIAVIVNLHGALVSFIYYATSQTPIILIFAFLQLIPFFIALFHLTKILLEWDRSRKNYEKSAEFSVDNNLPETLAKAIEKSPESVRDNKRLLANALEHVEIAELLIKNGAEIRAEHFKAIMWKNFSEESVISALQLLLTENIPEHKIWAMDTALQYLNLPAIKYLHELGIDLKHSDGRPLIYYSFSKFDRNNEAFREILQYLLEQGLDINEVTDKGKNILMLSCEKKESHFTCALIDKGADILATDNNENNLLHYYYQFNTNPYYLSYENRLILLLEKKGALQQLYQHINKQGSTIHMFMAKYQCYESLLNIIPHANMALTDNDGNSFIHYLMQNSTMSNLNSDKIDDEGINRTINAVVNKYKNQNTDPNHFNNNGLKPIIMLIYNSSVRSEDINALKPSGIDISSYCIDNKIIDNKIIDNKIIDNKNYFVYEYVDKVINETMEYYCYYTERIRFLIDNIDNENDRLEVIKNLKQRLYKDKDESLPVINRNILNNCLGEEI